MLKELPKKWCCRGYKEVASYSCKYGKIPPYRKNMHHYHHYPAIAEGRVTTSDYIREGYTEITLKDFKRLVLKAPEYQDIKTRLKNLKI